MWERSAAQLVELLGAWHHGGPTYRALADRIRLLVLDGRLPSGTRMPSERELARALGSSRTTVAAAYSVLREAGFLVSRRGAPSRIRIPPGARAPHSFGGGHSGAIVPADGAAGPVGHTLDLAAAALPAPPGMAEAVEAATCALPAYLSGHGYTPLGVPSLRELLAHRYTQRGLPTTPDQIMVMGGSLQAFALILRAFVSPGERVVVDHPTYPNVLEAIRQVPARTVPVPLGPDGWDVTMYEATLRQSAPRLAYLVPDFHNPTGALMPARTRERIAAITAKTRTLTVVDETLVDLALDLPASEMPPPLAAYDQSDHVLSVGSTSKCYWGGLGVGWVRAPASLVPTLLAARAVTDLGTSVLGQLTAAELVARHETILETRCAMLRSRRAALIDALQSHLPSWRFVRPPGGLSLWCELDAPVSSTLAVMAAQQGVRLAEGPRFGTDGAFERFVRLPFTLPEAELVEAVERLADVSAALASRTTERALPTGRGVRRPAADLTPVVT
ncbi:MAG TPA: PLP-dependent aminotransferase family protein [Actinopolymorphaceae bacterium]|jgi:hypothetical protein